jgi:hypothetical protein
VIVGVLVGVREAVDVGVRVRVGVREAVGMLVGRVLVGLAVRVFVGRSLFIVNITWNLSIPKEDSNKSFH